MNSIDFIKENATDTEMTSEEGRLIGFPPTMMIVSMTMIATIDRQDIRATDHHLVWYNTFCQDMRT